MSEYVATAAAACVPYAWFPIGFHLHAPALATALISSPPPAVTGDPMPGPRSVSSRLLERSEAALEQQVAERFQSLDYSSVRNLLVTHRVLSELLLEAAPVIERIFGAGTNVTLVVVDDHDTDNDERLVARIQTHDSVTVAREKRKQLYRDWWNASLERAQGRLHFDLDFV